jgi:hypothetical protein
VGVLSLMTSTGRESYGLDMILWCDSVGLLGAGTKKISPLSTPEAP